MLYNTISRLIKVFFSIFSTFRVKYKSKNLEVLPFNVIFAKKSLKQKNTNNYGKI